MNSFKLLFVFILLLLGSFAQRFQRHLFNGTQNGMISENSKIDNLDALSSDEEIYVPDGDDVKFVRDGREVELELKYKELMFKFCSDGCMDQTVIACYDSTNSNSLSQGDCDPGQCEFKAGVLKDLGKNLIWFKSDKNLQSGYENKCETAIMAFPETKTAGFRPFPSCEPLKHDGNVVKLYVRQVPPGCPFYVVSFFFIFC
uniref:Uncharacterized protein n=1 Tax=Panagrolaimus davidi TaxID=227884 RepID=A0A914PSG6_9BILA